MKPLKTANKTHINSVYNILNKSEYIILLSILSIITVINIIFTLCYQNPSTITRNTWNYNMAWSLLSIMITIILIAIIIIKHDSIKDALNKLKLKHIIIIMSVFILIMSALWITCTHYITTGDTAALIINAKNAVNHERLTQDFYLEKYPYQSGLFLYVYMFTLLFPNIKGSSIYTLTEYVNIGIILLTFLLIVKLTYEMTSKNALIAKYASIITGLFLPIIVSVIIVYNNILSIPFILLSIISTIKIINNEKRYLYTILLLFSVIIMGLLKPNNIIIAIALIITFILQISKSKQSWKNIIIYLLLSIIMIPLMITSQNVSINAVSGITGITMNDGDKQPVSVFIATGLSDDSSNGPGAYNGVLSNPKRQVQEQNEESKQIIHDRLDYFKEKPLQAVGFFISKILYTWSDPTYSYATRPANEMKNATNIQAFNYEFINSHIIMIIIRTISDIVCMMISITAVTGFIILNKNHTENNVIILPALIITGGFLFHIIWETQPEYAYTYFLLFIPYAAVGLKTINEFRLNKRISNETNL